MLSFKTFLVEGGNVKLIGSAGEDVSSNPIDLTKTPRRQVQNDVRGFLSGLNQTHIQNTGSHLFGRNEEALQNGAAFAGSTNHLFDKNISDEEHNQFKPSVGDIDTMVPREHMQTLEQHLQPGTKYGNYTVAGTKKHGSQISAIVKHDNGEHHQIDFEPADYEGNNVSDWNKFSHSSNWDDTKQGIKGSQHKILLRALTAAHGSYGKIRTKKGDQEGFVNSQTFSVDKGLRRKYELTGTDEDNKPVFQELPSKGAEYETDVPKIYEGLIGKRPTKNDLSEFGSFQGVSRLINKHLSPEQRSRVLDRYVDNLYGSEGGLLDKDHKKDQLVKDTALNHLMQQHPDHFTDEKKKEIDGIRKQFYSGLVAKAKAKEALQAVAAPKPAPAPKKTKKKPVDTFGGAEI